MGFRWGPEKFCKIFTKNDVTLGSGGFGWTTGHQDYVKPCLGHVWSRQKDVPNTPEFVFINFITIFVNFCVISIVDHDVIIESFR